MTWTQTSLSIVDGSGTARTVIAYTDGTNYSFAHPLLDNTGAIIPPARSDLQTAGNTSLAAIAAAAATPLSPPPLIVTGSQITRPANTTAYAFGSLIANSTTAGSVTPGTIAAARGVNAPGTIQRCRLLKSGTSLTNAIFRVHLYNQVPTVTNGDGGVWLSTSSGYVGSLDVTVDKAFSDISAGVGIPSAGSTMAFTPATGTQNLYYLIEARNAYTPVSGETFTPVLEVQ